MEKQERLFKKGAWLYTLEKALTEKQFIEKAGGAKALEPYKQYPFISIILDKEKPILIGHNNGRVIALGMQTNGCEQWQTMEWR